MFIYPILHLNQLIPHSFIAPQILVVNGNDTIILNIDFLSDLFNYIYFKHQSLYSQKTKKDVLIPLSSTILRTKYGDNYMYYIKYLLDEDFIRKVKNYEAGSHCNTYRFMEYKIDTGLVEYQNKNAKLVRAHNKELLDFNLDTSIYSKNLVQSVIKCLKTISLEEDAIRYLNSKFQDKTDGKYLKNLQSIQSISDRNIYIKVDKHGRMHTNFTVLRKDIRNQFLRIDGETIKEKDISNSQALFFLYLMSKNLNPIIDKSELYRIMIHIIDGTIYDHLASVANETRVDMKLQFFEYLFGSKNSKFKVFNTLYPSISKYIKAYKSDLGDYKLMSHHLQLSEGDFIYNGVCKELSKKKVKYFTIHDSVCVKHNDFNVLEPIFEKSLNDLKMDIQNNIDQYYRT